MTTRRLESPQERARKLRPYIVKASESLSDSDALECIELYDPWAPGIEYEKDKRLSYDSKLWRVLQKHTSQEQYPPSIDTASLYTEVAKPGEGDSPETAIAYNNNMALENGKYYSQYDVIYICFRDTGTPVYNDLKDLVNIYVTVYEG